MGQPIDPQLGVPTTPNLDIPQIPYKKLPFPYQDLTNVPQPDNAQYYPDHIPGVVSTVAAMHPSGTQAQEIHTNGKNAMMVEDANGSGGAALWEQAIPIGYQRDVISPFDDDKIKYGNPQYFFSLSATVAIQDYGTIGSAPGIYADAVNFLLNVQWGIMSLHLGGYFDGTQLHGIHCNSGLYVAPAPIDLSLLTQFIPDQVNIHISNNTAFDIIVYLNPTFSKTG